MPDLMPRCPIAIPQARHVGHGVLNCFFTAVCASSESFTSPVCVSASASIAQLSCITMSEGHPPEPKFKLPNGKPALAQLEKNYRKARAEIKKRLGGAGALQSLSFDS